MKITGSVQPMYLIQLCKISFVVFEICAYIKYLVRTIRD